MQNRHTTQIRELLQKKRLSKSRFNPESRVVVTSPSMKQSRQLKKSQSSTSLHHQKQKIIELQIMEKRYEDLYKEYFKIVEETKKRAEMCKKQEEQIYKYQKAGERDQKEIERLKSMIGFVQKRQSGVQTIQEKTNFDKDYNRQPPSRLIKKNPLKQSRSQKDIQTSSNTKYRIISQNDQNKRSNIIENHFNANGDQRLMKKSYLKSKNLLSSKEEIEIDPEKYLLLKNKRFQSAKMTDSLLYANKSSVDLNKKRRQLKKGFQLGDNRQEGKYSRVNSPNSRFKFIPSVDI